MLAIHTFDTLFGYVKVILIDTKFFFRHYATTLFVFGVL